MNNEPIPIVSWEVAGPAVIEPEMELEYDRQKRSSPAPSYPECCILCYQSRAVNLAIERCGATKVEPVLRGDLYEFTYKDKRIGIIQSGIGAPMAGLIVERLVVRGVKYILSVGTAGSLQYQDVKAGDIILCIKAVRSEGTSYHYLAPSRYSFPDPQLTKAAEKVLTEQGIRHKKGPSITIDGPYRMTISKARQLREEGVLAAEMEASAVFAISQFRKVKAAAMFTISDLATEDFKWQPKFDTDALQKGHETLFKACIETFASVK